MNTDHETAWTGDNPAGQGWRPPGGSGVPPPTAADRDKLSGQVHSLQQRTEFAGDGRGRQVVSFRLERHDAAGNRLPPIPVELRGNSFRGSVTDGDWVQVHGRRKDGTLQARTVRNLTTGGTVRVTTHRATTVVVVVAGLVVLGVIVAVAITVLGGFPPKTTPTPIHDRTPVIRTTGPTR